MPRRARPLVRLLALSALALVAAGSDYRGCSGGSAPVDGAELPEATGGCLVDADCVSEDMCVALVCRAGTCVEAGLAMDGDGDTFAREPCGMDCDDGDPDIRPGAAERCDGIDQDCDGRIDEGATGIRTVAAPEWITRAKIVGMATDYAVVGVAVDGDPANTLGAYVIGPDGASSVPALVGTDLAPLAFDVARDGDALQVAMIAEPDGTPSRFTLTRAGDTWSAAGPPEPLPGATFAERVATLVLDGQQWIVVDARGAGGAGGLNRWLWRSGDPSGLVDLGPVELEHPADLATDGTRVWATIGERRLVAYDAEGLEVAAQELLGPFGSGPLASGDGLVYAVYRDAFDHSMTRVTTEAFTAAITAPAGNAADRVSILRAGADVLVTRVDDFGITGALLEDDLRTYRATFDAGDLGSPGRGPARVSASATDDGIAAVLSSHDDAFDPAGVAILRCSTTP